LVWLFIQQCRDFFAAHSPDIMYSTFSLNSIPFPQKLVPTIHHGRACDLCRRLKVKVGPNYLLSSGIDCNSSGAVYKCRENDICLRGWVQTQEPQAMSPMSPNRPHLYIRGASVKTRTTSKEASESSLANNAF
jgi:hypothetical protein